MLIIKLMAFAFLIYLAFHLAYVIFWVFPLRKKKHESLFKYRSRVSVTDGFYKGCIGTINSECNSPYYEHRYEVGILNAGQVEKFAWIPAKYLKMENF